MLPDHVERNCSPKEALAAWCDLVSELLSGRQSVGRECVAVDTRVRSTRAQLQILEELRSFAQVQRENSQQRWQPNFRSALDILDDLSKRLERVSTASDKVLTSKMAAEREVQSLRRIHEAVQHYRHERSCCVCGETPLNDGLWCLAPETRHGELVVEPDAHFTCAACLEGIVKHECDANDPDGLTMSRLLENYEKMQKVVRCPGWFQGRRCPKCFEDRLVDGKIIRYPEAYHVLTQARQRVLERQLTTHYNALMVKKEEEIRKEMKRNSLSQQVARHRMHIVENILNLRCPRCKSVFVDFEGCCALTCGTCRCAFCAYCLLDCGQDAHPHVLQCPESPNPGKYYDTLDGFNTVQRRRRIAAIRGYVAPLSEEEKRMLRGSLERDLRDVGIEVDQAV